MDFLGLIYKIDNHKLLREVHGEIIKQYLENLIQNYNSFIFILNKRPKIMF